MSSTENFPYFMVAQVIQYNLILQYFLVDHLF
jgi:hypothetical protein